MNHIDFLSVAALAVVLILFAVIYFVQKKGANFSLVILGALIAGVLLGIVFSGHTSWVAPIGKIYVSVLGAIVTPLIIVSILSSVTSLGTVKQLKGIGLKSVFWLMITTLIAMILALSLGLIFGIGNNSYLTIDGLNAQSFENTVTSFSTVLVGFFPRNFISDIYNENIIPIILFSVLIAVSYVFAASENRKKVEPFKNLVEALKEIIFKAVDFIVGLTPYAVLALIITATGNGLNRSGIIWALLVLLIVSFLTFVIDTWVVNAVLIKVFAKLSPIKFFKKIVSPQVIGFSTQSSSGTLPVTIKTLTEKIGVDPKVANFTAPLGTTIGMPGCAGIWPILTAVFGVHALGIQYDAKDYAFLIVIGLFVSLGTAGVPGTATVTTASVLAAVGLPLELIVLTIPISAIADTGRTATNITGAIVASTIVGRREHALDEEIFHGRKDPGEFGEGLEGAEDSSQVDHTDDTEYQVPVSGGCRI